MRRRILMALLSLAILIGIVFSLSDAKKIIYNGAKPSKVGLLSGNILALAGMKNIEKSAVSGSSHQPGQNNAERLLTFAGVSFSLPVLARCIFLFAVLAALLASPSFAISNATVVSSANVRWNGLVSASSVTTQGGNISFVNINTSQLTTKWASFNGNVSGSVVLGNATARVYSWAASDALGGEVCVSTSATYAFASMTNTSAAVIDTAFSTSGNPDSAANTFSTLCPPLINVGGTKNLTNYTAAKTQGSSSFYTCAANTSTGTSTANDHAFCTAINSTGTNYIGTTTDFELIVPTGSSNRVYYFFLEYM